MKELKRPILVQGSSSPLVIRIGGSEHDLFCEGCNESVLIESYLETCFVGIGLKCFKCSHITWTAPLPEGDVLPKATINLGDKGEYFLTSPIKNEKNIVITCDQEIAKSFSPTKEVGEDLYKITIDNLDRIAVELDVLSQGNFKKYLDSAERSIAHGNVYYRENLLAWSIKFLRNKIVKGSEIKGRDALVAISMVHAYQNVLHRWRKHAHFSVLAKELCSYFYHSLIQLVAASYLSDAGNSITLNMTSDIAGERAADLYIKTSASEKFYIEVKAPITLEWTEDEIGLGRIKKAILKSLSKSRGQIDEEKPGILIIGTSCLSRDFLGDLEKIAKKVIKDKGRSYAG